MAITLTREYFLPSADKNATKLDSKTGHGVAYAWIEDRGGKQVILAKGFLGKRNKADFFHNFRTVEQRDAFVTKFLEDADAIANRVAAYKAEKKASKAAIDSSKHADGTIFVHSWGWEQTNVDFFRVVGRKSRTKLLVQPIGYKITKGCSGMSAYVTADLESTGGEVIEVTLVSQDSFHIGNSAKYTYGKSAHLWDGRETYCSWYA
jgi:hypothetical protein